MVRYVRNLAAVLVIVLSGGGPVRSDVLRIYIDADFSVTNSVGTAIELGLRAALAEGDNTVAGLPVEVVPLDHRSNPRRSRANLEKFQRDPNGIAVFGGKQSPPYLMFGQQINASGIPLLLPWSAGGPITRQNDGEDNFIFRLSVDDRKAGPFLVNAAITSGCNKVGLVLIDTAWGRANLKSMTAALAGIAQKPVMTAFVSTDVGPVSANNVARDLVTSGAQCVIAVLTARASIRVFSAIHELAPGVAVLSHWGLLSREFSDEVPAAVRDALKLKVIQTCGLDIEQVGSPVVRQALETARGLAPDLTELRDLDAPAGFVHAYDLGLLFRAAAEQAAETPEWSGGIESRRRALRSALEGLSAPVTGILGRYRRPFSPVSQMTPDGHEALGQGDLCLARFGSDGRLVAIRPFARADVQN